MRRIRPFSFRIQPIRALPVPTCQYVCASHYHPPPPSSLRRFASTDTTHAQQHEEEEEAREYFDPRVSEQEWLSTTQRLLETAELTPREIVLAQETVRWWTTQRSVPAVETCLQLMELITIQLQTNPNLLQAGELSYFYSGNVPKATHLWNAVVDTWRIQWEKHPSTTTLPDPYAMYAQTEQFASRGLAMNCRTYSIIMQASLAHPHKDTPLFCESLLNHMLQHPHTRPDTVAFTTAIHAWAKSKRPEAPLRAEQLFNDMRRAHDGYLLDTPPNTVTYNTVLDALCRSNHLDHVQRAQEIFSEMQLSPYPNVSPTTVSFRIMIFAWANVGNIPQACLLLKDMVTLYESGNPHVQIKATIFSKLISILAKSKDPKNYARADELYQVLVRLYQETRDDRFEPELFTTRAMIIVYSKLHRPVQAEALLQRLEKQASRHNDSTMLPKRGHYRDVLFAWAAQRSGLEAAPRAERILLRMIHVLESSSSLLEKSQSGRAPLSLVDKHTVDTVLQLWSRQSRDGRPDAAQRGDDLLRLLEKLNRESGTEVCKMGRSSYLHVMRGWASSKAPEAPQRIEALLAELVKSAKDGDKNRMPTSMHYSCAATAWLKSKSKQENAAERIQALFDQAMSAYEQGYKDARPDRTLYGTLIHGYAQQGDVDGAERVLNQMMSDAKSDNPMVQPTISEFNMVVLACLRSKEDLNATSVRTRRLLSSLQSLGLYANKRMKELLAEIESKRTVVR